MSEPTVARWLKDHAASTALVPVRIKPDEPVDAPRAFADAGPIIVTSRGWRVEGLCIADIATLLQVTS